MKKYRYEELLPEEFLNAVNEMPVFIVPLGLLEWHADHLPLGQDGLKAHGICLRIAEKLNGGIVLPPVYFGRPGFSTYTGTLTFSEGLIQSMLYELFYQLKKVGAKVVVFMIGHYGPAQEQCIAQAVNVLQHENPEMRIIAHRECDGIEIDGTIPCDHAGLWETSMFMSMYPELAHMEHLKEQPLPQKQYRDAPFDYYHEDAVWKWRNDVFQANIPLGERAVNAAAECFASEIMTALSEV